MQPDRIWSLLADVSRPDVASTPVPTMASQNDAGALGDPFRRDTGSQLN
jgi:hypothetical protein